MKFRGVKRNGKPQFDEATAARRAAYWGNLKEGQAFVEEIVKDVATKSQKQCAAIFGVYIPIIRQRMEDLGIGLFGAIPSKHWIIEILYQCCGGVGDGGENKTLSKMYRHEAQRFMENINDFCVMQLDGLVLPELHPNWKDLFPEKPKPSDIVPAIDPNHKDHQKYLDATKKDPRIEDIEHYGVQYTGKF